MREQLLPGNDPDHAPTLFALPAPVAPETLSVPTPDQPVWTLHKARLIQRYLFLFLMITRHGTYVDGFSGPQEPEDPDSWSAKLVLELEPKWIRRFHLFERSRGQLARLHALKASLPPSDERFVEIYAGDFNERVLDFVEGAAIGENEATFCLLDQWTFECQWATLRALAHKKTGRYKIELFYFLANSWLDRALAGVKRPALVEAWWGRSDWQQLRGMPGPLRAHRFADRMRRELGYLSVKPWAIYERERGGRTMYYMIHATDHPKAPLQMRRAYGDVIDVPEQGEQLDLELWAVGNPKRDGTSGHES
ncbi:MAG TPA: three-Cys-motif partner protein TcmP [Methylomirabilota bacterium]|nr:three-Cys-motif partner protein TcmP [Methylomirabilota bacterium]